MKRIFDLSISLIALVVLFPILLIVFLILLLSGGSPIYKQIRVGKNGTPFVLLKFRSMILDADKVGGFQTQKNDMRITKFGRFIRKTSIDELPQLLNVLAGDMSIVGPRPDVPKQKELYSLSDWVKRTSVRPGLTGLAQAKLRSTGTSEARLNLDLYYIDHQSILLDIKILFWTVLVLFSNKGN